MTLDLELEGFDVIVSLEVLAHVDDKRAFVSRMASLLRPGGMLMLATQNRPVLERCKHIVPKAEGQNLAVDERRRVASAARARFPHHRSLLCYAGLRSRLHADRELEEGELAGAAVVR